jgi:hypothetical protein
MARSVAARREHTRVMECAARTTPPGRRVSRSAAPDERRPCAHHSVALLALLTSRLLAPQALQMRPLLSHLDKAREEPEALATAAARRRSEAAALANDQKPAGLMQLTVRTFFPAFLKERRRRGALAAASAPATALQSPGRRSGPVGEEPGRLHRRSGSHQHTRRLPLSPSHPSPPSLLPNLLSSLRIPVPERRSRSSGARPRPRQRRASARTLT